MHVNPSRLATGTKSKLVPIQEAVANYIKPGIRLHIAGGIGGASAAICEIIRQYNGKSPGFELVQSTVTGHAINLLHCNLVRKLVFSACMDISPSGKPSKVMQKKWADRSIEFENWSLCALQERLMAGAFGFSCIPTRSITGSNMALDNHKNFKEISDPFDINSSISILKSLNPDVSIIHGCVADESGNTIMPIPYGDDIWGALASHGGILVTVEKIVSPEFIQKHSALVKIPGHMVKAVSVAPFGVHPFSLAEPGIPDIKGYESDVNFLMELHQAFNDSQKLDQWIKAWVLDCRNHEDYLKKLGEARLADLQRVTAAAPTAKSFSVDLPDHEIQPGYTSEEIMLVAASREIRSSIQKSHHKIVLLGAGSRSVAVLLAYHQLKAAGHRLEIITGNGQYGYEPLPTELALQSLAGVYSSKMVMDTVTSQGILIGGKNNQCLGVLGAGQIDKYGDTNSTLTSSGQFLVGSGGSNDVGNAKEVIVILNQSRDRFVEFLPYITCPGNRITTVISTLGIFTKSLGKKELILSACFPDPQMTVLTDRIKRIQQECGWSLRVSKDIVDIPEPTEEELKLLRGMMR